MRIRLIAVAMLLGCGGGGSDTPDAIDGPMIDGAADAPAPDAPIDAPIDAAIDATDATPDALDSAVDAPDGAPDAAVDAPVDAAPDAAPDAPVDAATDAPIDGPPPCVVPAFTTGVSTLTGCEIAGAVDGPRGTARLANPANVAVGPDGANYIADFDNHRIRVATPAGAVRTLTQQTGFIKPFGLAFGAGGALYVTTDDNPLGQHSQLTGTLWQVDTTTGAATPLVADIGRPRGLTALADGRLALADYLHHVVRIYDPGTGQLTTLAGTFDEAGLVDDTGAAARFFRPYGLTQLPDGSLAVADFANHVIRRVTLAGEVTTLAGTGAMGDDDGAALTAAQFSFPQDVAGAADGTLYIADTGNYVVRRLRTGTVDTVIGAGTAGWLDADDRRAAQLHGLEGIDLATTGLLYIADGSHGEDLPFHRIRVSTTPP